MYNGNKENTGLKQYIVFKIGQQNFGVDVQKSREIIVIKNITAIPEAPEFVDGVIDLRGKIVPIINLAKRLGLEKDDLKGEDKVIILSLEEENLVGIEVDKVDEIARINEREIFEQPEITKTVDRKFINGVAKLKDGLLVLLDLDKTFSKEEVTELNEMKI